MTVEVRTNQGVLEVPPDRWLVRRGVGWVVPIGSYAWVFFLAFATQQVGVAESFQEPPAVIGLGLVFAGLTTAIAHFNVRGQRPRHLVDAKTGLDFVLVRGHEYLWLGLPIWAVIQGGLGSLILTSLLSEAPA